MINEIRSVNGKQGLVVSVFILLIVCIAFFSVPHVLSAQTFLHDFGESSVNLTADFVRQTPDRGYLMFGKNYASGSLRLVKVNNASQVLWFDGFDAGLGTPVALNSTIDGVHLLTTTSHLVAFDNDGTLLWQGTFQDQTPDWSVLARDVRQTSDGGYIGTGWVKTFISRDVYKIWVFRMDSSRNMLWQKTFMDWNYLAEFQGRKIIEHPEGGYVLAAFNYPGSGTYASVAIIRLDENGTIVWSKMTDFRVAYNGTFAYILEMALTDDNGILFSAEAVDTGNTASWLIKLDHNGSVVWKHRYSAVYDFSSLSRVSPGEYLVSTYRTDIGNAYFWKVLENGTVPWSRQLIESNQWQLFDIVCTDDNGFIATGKHSIKMPLLKMNSDGWVPVSPCSTIIQTGIISPTMYYDNLLDVSLPVDSTDAIFVPSSYGRSSIVFNQTAVCEDLDVFSVDCSPATLFLDRGGWGSSTCTVTSEDWWGDVVLSATGLPVDILHTFSPGTVSMDYFDAVPSLLSLSDSGNYAYGTSFNFDVFGDCIGLSANDSLTVTIADLDAEPNPLVFDPVPAGGSHTATLVITNHATGQVRITGISSPASPFSIANNTCTDTVLEPDASCVLDIMFSPAQIGTITDTIAISTYQGQTSQVLLSGTGTSPDIELDLVAPNGGEAWEYSPDAANRKEHLIVWEQDYFFNLERTVLSYSTDDGLTWDCITDSGFNNYDAPAAVSIPAGPASVSSPLTVPDSLTISDVNVMVRIDHAEVQHLFLKLIGPDAREVILGQSLATGINLTDTIFDDDAATSIIQGSAPFTGFFVPVEPLELFHGMNAGGTWQLEVENASELPGTIVSWRINFSDCHNRNISGSSVLTTSSTSFRWELPTQEEAAQRDQVLPSARCRVRLELTGQDPEPAMDVSDSRFYLMTPTSTSIGTLVLYNSERLCQAFETDPLCDCGDWQNDPDCTVIPPLLERLQALLEHPRTYGTMLDLATVPPIQAAYALWDAAPTDQALANDAATAIRDYVHDQIGQTFSNAHTIILIGDDGQVPFFRMADGTSIYPENNYLAESGIDTGTPIGSAIAQNFLLTDNFYTEFTPETSGLLAPHDTIYLNDLLIGRLVETPVEMIDLVDQFLAHNGIISTVAANDRFLVTGYDFFYDSGCDIRNLYPPTRMDYLLDDPQNRPDAPCGDFEYGATDLRNALLTTPPHKIVTINTHANHYSFGAPDLADPVLTTSDLEAESAHLTGTILISSGCHSGLPVPPVVGEPNPLDLPQEMARKEVLAYIGNTGYGWGLLQGKGLTETLVSTINENIRNADSITIGKAMAQAKRTYLLEEKRYDVFDEKVLHELTLFGIPNLLIVNTLSKKPEKPELPAPDGPDSGCADGICLSKRLSVPSTKTSLPPGVTELELNFSFSPETYQQINTPDGDYYCLNGLASGEVGDTIQPRFVYNSSLSGTNAHGVLFTGGIYSTESSFDPVVAVPRSTYIGQGEGPLPLVSTFTPCVRVSYGTSGGSTQKIIDQNGFTNMVVHTGLFDSISEEQSRFETMQFVIYYSPEADTIPPLVTDPGPTGFHTIEGMNAHFSVPVSDDSGIFRVLITYLEADNTSWQSLDLAYDNPSNTWNGDLTIMHPIIYFAQAVDNKGNVGLLSVSGDDLDGSLTPYGSTWSGPQTYEIILPDFDEDGLPDAYENMLWCLDMNDPDDAAHDFDYDYLSSEQEFLAGTSPCSGDSDGGGDNDGSELGHGRDPFDLSDDLHLTIHVNKVDQTYTIDWLDDPEEPLNVNDQISGYYFVYRSGTWSFSPTDLISGPVPNEQNSFDDVQSGPPPCDPCYYKVWNYQLDTPSPVVDSVVPNNGPVSGGTAVKIYGENFQADATVSFCGIPATSVIVVSAFQIKCTTPAAPAGVCDISVMNSNNQHGTLEDGFIYN